MTDAQSLYLLLAVLYLSECVRWVDVRSVVFKVHFPARASGFLSRGKFSNDRGGMDLLNPLVPTGLNLVAHCMPVSLSPEGIYSGLPATAGASGAGMPLPRAISYGDIRSVGADGKTLLIDGKPFRECASDRQARSVSSLIDRLRGVGRDGRAELLREELSARFSCREAEGRWREVARAALPLRICCLLAFAWMYLVLPLLAIRFSLQSVFVPAVAGIVCFSVAISALFLRARGRLYPEDGGGRLAWTIKYLVCPPGAVRATDHLTWNAMDRHHPVVLGKLFLGDAGPAFGKRVLRELRHPCGEAPPEPLADGILAWHSREELGRAMAFVEREFGIGRSELFPVPERDAGSTRYCPRCLSQFQTQAGECTDCPGVALVEFDAERPTKVKDGD